MGESSVDASAVNATNNYNSHHAHWLIDEIRYYFLYSLISKMAETITKVLIGLIILSAFNFAFTVVTQVKDFKENS